MSDLEVQVGTITKQADGSFHTVLTREYSDASAADVWAMATDPAKFPLWLAPGSIEMKQGGAVNIDFEDSGFAINSTVKEFKDGEVIAYSWSSGDEPERLLRFVVAAEGTGVKLTLEVSTPAGEDPAKACAGFEAHLEMFSAALAGVPMKFPFNHFVAARTAYSEQLQ